MLYVTSLFVTQAVILDDKLKYLSSIPWFLTFAIPAYILGRFNNNKWYVSAFGIGIFSNLVWLLHSQLLFIGTFPINNVLVNLALCLISAYIGYKRKASNNAFKRDAEKAPRPLT